MFEEPLMQRRYGDEEMVWRGILAIKDMPEHASPLLRDESLKQRAEGAEILLNLGHFRHYSTMQTRPALRRRLRLEFSANTLNVSQIKSIRAAECVRRCA